MQHQDDLLAGADVILGDEILNQIDQVVAPGADAPLNSGELLELDGAKVSVSAGINHAAPRALADPCAPNRATTLFS